MKMKLKSIDDNKLERNSTSENYKVTSNWIINAGTKYEFKWERKLQTQLLWYTGVKGKICMLLVRLLYLDHIYRNAIS
jgi:hypothetical protein